MSPGLLQNILRILVLLVSLGAQVGQILQAVQQLARQFGTTAGGALADRVEVIWRWVTGGPYSYATFSDGVDHITETLTTAIQSVRQDSAEPHLPTIYDVLTAIDLTDHVVRLPTIPPSGYGGGGGDGWAATHLVQWLYDQSTMETRGEQLDSIQASATMLAQSGQLRLSANPDFALVSAAPGGGLGDVQVLGDPAHAFPAPVDWHSWGYGEDIATFLNHAEGSFNWTHQTPWPGVTSPDWAWTHVLEDEYWLICLHSQRDWYSLSGQLERDLKSLAVLGKWPGADLATLLTPVVLTASGSVDGPMMGILVSIDDVTPNTPFWQTDVTRSYKYAGYVAFVADNGAVETHQYLSPVSAIYVPHSMVIASKATVYLSRATQVTVTPWVFTGIT